MSYFRFQTVLLLFAFSLSAEAVQVPYDLPSQEEAIVRRGFYSQVAINRDRDLRLTVWNVQKFGSSQALIDLKNLAHISDLVLLQEAMNGGAFDRFFERFLTMAWTGVISFFYDDRSSTGVTTGSRVRASYEGYLRSEAREPIAATPKMIALTKYSIENSVQELLVANIHGINFVRPSGYARQMWQLEAAVSGHKGPLIVAGDFNTHLPDRAYFMKRLAENLNLRQVTVQDQGSQWFVLDHIFVRGLEPRSAKVLLDINSSDHYPLYAIFKMN